MVNAKQAALHFVDTQLQSGDEVGIIGFSRMSGFFIKEYLTTDRERIRKAIKKTKEIRQSYDSSSGAELDQPRSVSRVSSSNVEISKNPESSNSKDLNPSRGEAISVVVPGSIRFQRRDFVSRMTDLAQALKYIPGNKSLILFSSRNLGATSTKLGNEFADASTPVYTINTQNWIVEGVINSSVKKKHIWTNHPLEKMSQASGGKYFADIEDVETISRDVHLLTGNFYVLGYYVPDTWDGQYHQVKVEVKSPDLNVLAQDGYFNPKPFTSFSDFEKKLHLYDLVYTEKPATLVPFEILLEPLFIAGRKETNCVLFSQIAIDEKTGVPPAAVEIYAFLFNEENESVLMKKGEIDLAPFDQQTLYSYFTASLPAGKYECRIVTRDKETGQSAVGIVNFPFPEQSDAGIVLSSPLLFAEGPESNILKLSEEQSGKEEDISLSDLYKFRPKNHSLVVRDLGSGIRSLLAVLPMEMAEGMVPEVEFIVRLHPMPNGEPIELMTKIVDIQKTSANINVLILEIKLPELKFGEYELEIEAVDKNTLARSFVRKSLVIK
jgi:VWFA-related protein